MKYKLKESVTEEQLLNCFYERGRVFVKPPYEMQDCFRKEIHRLIYKIEIVVYSTGEIKSYKWKRAKGANIFMVIDPKRYIRKLISKGYVEVEE